MVYATPEAIRELTVAVDQEGNKLLVEAYKNMHGGHPVEVASRFLKARENDVSRALQMILDSLQWRIIDDIDNVLSRPIEPKDTYDAIRESIPIGMTGFCRKGRPVFVIGVGSNGLDKFPPHMYVQSHIQINEYRDKVILPNSSRRMGYFVGTCLKIFDMTNLRISTLSDIKILSLIATIDDLNYPEKTDTYYIANAPYIFQACWRVVRPLLHERTKRKVHVLSGCGREELLKVMDENVLPDFCRSDIKLEDRKTESCFSPSHPFHEEMWNYMKQEASKLKCVASSTKKTSHTAVPLPREEEFRSSQSTCHHFADNVVREVTCSSHG
ncbi:hypothetical protein KP509_37G032700 [Ceratopteris richardii]|uniref:CRAL-TRIO domain-containing protein n=1 Tax=Ceratopteris richardii TaxID=49495 RepID=A0A8T2Q8W0_CERRI|nr:hypothetical protein KP509_37G032700 [Ceratopteris richardii]